MKNTAAGFGWACCFLAFWACSGVMARDYHVDQGHPSAADTNPGTPEAPLKTVSAAAARAVAGDTVRVQPGVYRESVTLTNSGAPGRPIVFRSEVPRGAVLCGSDVITGWQPAGPGVWMTDTPGLLPDNKYALPHSERGGEWVYMNGSPLLYSEPGQRQMPGTFRLDRAAKKLYVAPEDGLALDKVTVEYACREGLFWPSQPLDDIHIIGFTLRHTAIWFRGKPAVLLSGRRWRVEDNHVLWSSYAGIVMKHTSQAVVRNNLIEWCGEGGLGGGWNIGMLIESNRVQYCNWRRNDPSNTGCGGSKWSFSYDSVVRDNRFAFNQGSGIWFDWGNCNNVIERNVSHDNSAWGLFSECNWDETFRDNVVYNCPYGLVIAESPGSVARRNICFNNEMGLFLRGIYNRSNGAGYTPEGEAHILKNLARIPDLPPSAVDRVVAGFLKYHWAVKNFISNNSVLWENFVFDNETALWEGRDYGVPGPKDPFINNFSDYNVFSVPAKSAYRSDPSLMRHTAGGYPTLAAWQKVSGRDAHSIELNAHAAGTNLPAWVEAKRVLWDIPLRRRADGHTLGLIDGPTACIAQGRWLRSTVSTELTLSDPQVKAFLIDVEGEKTLMLWTCHSMSRRYVRLALDQDEIVVEDGYLQGARRTLPSRAIDLVVTWVPVYLKGIKDGVREAPTASVSVTPFNPPDKPVRLTARFPNAGAAPAQLQAAISVFPGFTAKPDRITQTVAAGTTAELTAELIPDGSLRRGPATVRLEATLGDEAICRNVVFSIGESGGTVPRQTGAVTLDGKLDEWPAVKDGLPPLALIGETNQFVIGERKAWQGLPDLSGKVYATWSTQALHLAVIVADERILGMPAPANPWEGDCVEVFVDGRSGDMQWQVPPTDGCFQIAVAPGTNPVAPNIVTWAQAAPRPLRGLAVATATNATGFVVEMMIPLTLRNFPAGDWTAGRPIKLSVLLYDRDDPATTHTDYILGWAFSPEGRNFNNTSGWRTLILE
jgi:hypothetical protein